MPAEIITDLLDIHTARTRLGNEICAECSPFLVSRVGVNQLVGRLRSLEDVDHMRRVFRIFMQQAYPLEHLVQILNLCLSLHRGQHARVVLTVGDLKRIVEGDNGG